MSKIKICIADDHPVFLAGLLSVIGRREDIEICGQAGTGTDALTMLRTHQPDIALLDIQMPGIDGLQVSEEILKELPELKIILLTMFNDQQLVQRSFAKGVKGYVLKENAVTQITQAIDIVVAGGMYISSQLSSLLTGSKIKKPASEEEVFTVAEKRILKYIAEGKSSKEIAALLNISSKTVENHRGNICKKLGITGTASLLRYAVNNKSQFE